MYTKDPNTVNHRSYLIYGHFSKETKYQGRGGEEVLGHFIP